jgi:superfamily II DNA or RNA helicase
MLFVHTSVISRERLRSLAGYAYARGEAYWRDGRVRSCERDGNRLRGTVDGGERYLVEVALTGATMASSCSCPVRFLCKHAVALVLHALANDEGTAVVSPAVAPVVPAVAPTVTPAVALADIFATRAELAAFASEHGVEHVLSTSASMLTERLGLAPRDPARHLLRHALVRDVGALQTGLLYPRPRGFDLAMARAAHALLHEVAAIVRAGIAEEALQREVPEDPGLARLWRKLVALRAEVRGSASPRGRAGRNGRWSFEARERELVWREPDRVKSHSHSAYEPVACVARLAFPDGERAELSCACNVRGRCTHGLALIDATLDRLADPASAEARTVAEQLLAPPWMRALAELEPVRAAAEIEVWWELQHEARIELRPLVKKQTRRGWTRGARVQVDALLASHGEQLDARDRAVAEALAYWQVERRGSVPTRALVALAGHPRVVLEGEAQRVEIVRASLGFNAVAEAEAIRLEPAVAGERINPRLLAELLDAFEPGEPLLLIEPEERRCLLVEVTEDARRLWTAISRHGDAFPPEAHAPLLDKLARLESRVPIALSRSLKGSQLAARPTAVARLRLSSDATLELELFVRPAPGTPLFPPGVGPRDVLLVRDGERCYVRRDLDAELPAARRAIAQLPLEGAIEGPPQCWQITAPQAALAVVAAIQAGAAAPGGTGSKPRSRAGAEANGLPGLEVEWVDDRPVIRRSSGVEGLRVRIERKRDWFGITGDLPYEDGRIELAILLDAARRQQRYVRVDDNRWVELSAALRDKLLAVSDQVFAAGDRLELSAGAVPAIRALREAGARIDAAAAWQQLTERLAASRALRPKPPATLKATLRDYQIEGHAWLSRVAAWGAGACLADDMGLGKTIQAIAVLLDRARLGPALVLAPTSVALNWVDELRRFAPSLRPIVYGSQPDRAATIARAGKRDVLIVSYGLLARDAELLASRSFATLVADEAQALKNPATRRAKAARALVADFRIGLSGTPFENHLGELWSLFSILFPGLFGSWERFRERFAVPIEKHGDADARAALARVLRPFLLRRTKQEVARELPARTEIDVPVMLSDEERAIYEDARLAAIAELAGKSERTRDPQRRFQVLAALTRLRLLACHPRLHDPASQLVSSKLARALELLEELRDTGHRALVFSQFTSHLALVREALERAGFSLLYLDGSTPARERARLVKAFQAGEGDVFLISLKAGGQGINLTAADYVLHLDPWWNPAVEDQATDRAHRIGQDQPVTVYRLIARDTIEDRIRSLHDSKRALVAGVLAGSDAAARLSTKDLMELLAAR